MRHILILLASVALVGCARTSVIPIAADAVQITTAAAPVCGQVGAQRVALEVSAIETINRGFDRFLIVGNDYSNNVGAIGTTPLVSNSTGTFNAYRYGNSIQGTTSSTTTITGGQPIIAGTHDQAFVVQMFREADPDAENAVDARLVLGENWQKIAQSGKPITCF